MLFVDRYDAGRCLGARLAEHFSRTDAIVLGLPRGGVPVAYEVAKSLHAPLDVFVVRKIGLPWHPELAIGAIASGGVRVFDDEAIRAYGVTREQLNETIAREEAELERREHAFRGSEAPASVTGKTAILVDDGLATGASMLAAVKALRLRRPKRSVVAVPVASVEACDFMRDQVDVCVCVETPEPFYAVGVWYHDFSQTSDEEVAALLAASRIEAPSAVSAG